MADNYNQLLISEAKDFLYENSNNYLSLLNEVKLFIKSLRNEQGGENIYRIYSRKDNKSETDEFKSIEKIVEKLIKWRSVYNPESQPKDLHDVIGITIVVYYISDIEPIFRLIKSNCSKYNFKIIPYLDGEEKKLYVDFGYYAQHLVISSLNLPYIGLKCEIQIKTLLHDAWHAKTHDLIYKPPGELGEDLVRLMHSFGESIQALEVQSEVIRTLITQHWTQEEELRHSARMHVIDWLKTKSFSNQFISDEYKSILNEINSKKDHIRSCSIADNLLKYLIEKLEGLRNSEDGLDAAWLLMVCLASIRRDNHLNAMTREYLAKFLKKQSDARQNCWHASFAYHMIGERRNAINEIKNFLQKYEGEEDVTVIKFNLLYYLIEEASYTPHHYYDLKSQCDKLIKELELENQSSLPSASVKDTLGYYYIIFGEAREEILKGIRMCQAAYNEKLENHEPDERYSELHERIGWRRLLTARPI